MKAIILTAGNGNRMLPLTQTHIKAMLPICGRPFLSHIIDNLMNAGITDLIIVTSTPTNLIRDYFKDGAKFGVSIKYVIQHEQLGTAHAISMAQQHINENERFFVLSGDTIVTTDELKSMLKVDTNIVLGTMFANHSQSEYGIVETNGQYVSKIIEKPKHSLTYLVNAGIYIFDSTIFESITKTNKSIRDEFEITDSIQQIINDDVDIEYIVFHEIYHISYPWDLLEYNERYMFKLPDQQLIEGDVESGVTLNGPIIIKPGAKIRSGTYIEGPAFIGADCDIGPNCYIRPYTCIGNNVRIGSAVEIKNSIIMRQTNIAHFSYIGDSIIGINCNFGAGTQVANLRHDNANIKVTIGDQVFDSARRKLGTIMGDYVKTGINCMLNAGSTIDSNSLILPGELVTSHHITGPGNEKK